MEKILQIKKEEKLSIRIDGLGRIHLPIYISEKLNIQEGDKLYIYRSGINIILEKSNFKIEKKIILKEKKIINNETEICIEISEIKNSILENEKGKLRAVDELRNCVIPIEIRNELGIVDNDTFKPHIKGNKIILVKERKRRW